MFCRLRLRCVGKYCAGLASKGTNRRKNAPTDIRKNEWRRNISDRERLTISGNIRLPYGILDSLTKVAEWLRYTFFRSQYRNRLIWSSVVNWGYSCTASSQLPVLVSLRKAVQSARIFLSFSASPLSSCKDIVWVITWSRSWHCSSSSITLMGARYCCLNSDFDRSVARFSFCPLSLACSNRSMTWTARSQTRTGNCCGWSVWTLRKQLSNCWVRWKLKVLSATWYKMVSDILQLQVLLASRALTPDVQSPYQLHHYLRRALYIVNAILLVTTTARAHTTTTLHVCNPCRPFCHTKSGGLDNSECLYSWDNGSQPGRCWMLLCETEMDKVVVQPENQWVWWYQGASWLCVAVVPWVTTVFPLVSGPSPTDCWLNISHM